MSSSLHLQALVLYIYLISRAISSRWKGARGEATSEWYEMTTKNVSTRIQDHDI
jgi:hypothetical protein